MSNETNKPEQAQYFPEFNILAGGELQHAYFLSSTGEAFRLQINSSDVNVLQRVQDALGIHVESV